jgi:colanic acid/amylovoran biosynthesis protein
MVNKILLINVHSSYNAGDAALTRAAIDQLHVHYPKSTITLIMNDPRSHLGDEPALLSFLTWVNKPKKHQAIRFFWLVFMTLIPLWTHRLFGRAIYTPRTVELKETIKAYIAADLVVSTPGGYLYSYGRGRALIIILYTMWLALAAGKPLYLFPQSYGPLKHNFEFSFTRYVLSRARKVMAREQLSYEYLKNLGIPVSNCFLLPDMAFTFKGGTSDDADLWIANQGIDPLSDRPLMGLTIIDWGAQFQGFTHQEKYETAVSALIRHFIARYQGKAILFPQCWGPSPIEDDRIPSSRVAERLNDLAGSILVVKSPLSPDLLKAVYGEMDLFIGTRMHSNIFALSQHVPVIAIGYLHKTQGIALTVGIEEWVLDIHDIESSIIIEKFDRWWLKRDQIRQQLEQTIPGVIQKALQAGELVANDYINIIRVNK